MRVQLRGRPPRDRDALRVEAAQGPGRVIDFLLGRVFGAPRRGPIVAMATARGRTCVRSANTPDRCAVGRGGEKELNQLKGNGDKLR